MTRALSPPRVRCASDPQLSGWTATVEEHPFEATCVWPVAHPRCRNPRAGLGSRTLNPFDYAVVEALVAGCSEQSVGTAAVRGDRAVHWADEEPERAVSKSDEAPARASEDASVADDAEAATVGARGKRCAGDRSLDRAPRQRAASAASLGIAAGPDGSIWYDGVRRDPGDDFHDLRTPYQLSDLTVGPDGNMWGMEVRPRGPRHPGRRGQHVPQLRAGTGDTECDGKAIVSGPDGNVWFTRTTTLGGSPSTRRRHGKGAAGSRCPAPARNARTPAASTRSSRCRCSPPTSPWDLTATCGSPPTPATAHRLRSDGSASPPTRSTCSASRPGTATVLHRHGRRRQPLVHDQHRSLRAA